MPRGVPTIIIILLTALGLGVFVWWAGKAFAPAAEPAPAILPAPAEMRSVKVMTANIRLDDPADGDNGWAHRRALLIKTFLKHQPDVIACQEVSPAQGAYLNKELAQWYAYYPRAGVGTAPATSQSRSAGAALLGVINDSLASLNTIYYRKDRFDILDGEAGLVLPEEPQANATENTYFSLAVLRVSHTRAEDPAPLDVVVVVDVHLRHNDAFAARCASRVRDKLATWMAKYPGAVGVVMGDMNHARGSAAYKALTEGGRLLDTFDYAKGSEGTYHAFKGRANATSPTDLIFGAGDWVPKTPAQIIKDHDGSRFPSDHFFVMDELGRPAATE